MSATAAEIAAAALLNTSTKSLIPSPPWSQVAIALQRWITRQDSTQLVCARARRRAPLMHGSLLSLRIPSSDGVDVDRNGSTQSAGTGKPLSKLWHFLVDISPSLTAASASITYISPSLTAASATITYISPSLTAASITSKTITDSNVVADSSTAPVADVIGGTGAPGTLRVQKNSLYYFLAQNLLRQIALPCIKTAYKSTATPSTDTLSKDWFYTTLTNSTHKDTEKKPLGCSSRIELTVSDQCVSLPMGADGLLDRIHSERIVSLEQVSEREMRALFNSLCVIQFSLCYFKQSQLGGVDSVVTDLTSRLFVSASPVASLLRRQWNAPPAGTEMI